MALSRDARQSASRNQVAPKLYLLYHMTEAIVVKLHTHDWEEGSFKSIDMVYELDVLSGDFAQLILTRTDSGSKLAKPPKDGISAENFQQHTLHCPYVTQYHCRGSRFYSPICWDKCSS